MKSVKNFADLRPLLDEKRFVLGDDTPKATGQTTAPREALMRIVLQRRIDVRCWHVVGQVAKASKRTELMPVLVRARERGQTSEDDVAEHLLFEPRSRRVVAQRLLHIAARYGLLVEQDRRFVLTEAGAAALQSEQIFVPEQGTWTIWASNEPLLGYPILRIDAWSEPTAYEEIRGKGREAQRTFEKLPRRVLETIGVASVPAADDGSITRIDYLELDAEVIEPSASLRVEWDVTGQRLRLAGSLADARVSTALEAPNIPVTTVWRQLLESEGLWPRWDDAANALRVGFGETTERERESLLRDLTITRPVISELGGFDELPIRDVALRAHSAQDAALWAAWRLQARVQDYATAERFSMWSIEASKPFVEFQPTTPLRHALAAEAWRARGERPTPTAWHLVAAEDWSL